jgi:hypothetical protein
MNKLVLAGLAMLAFAGPALAGGTRYYVERDTVGNCSVVDSKPSAGAGMKILGDKGGYASKDAATKALKALPKGKCKGVVG